MNIHEYQAKALLKPFAIPLSPGRVIFSSEEGERAYQELNVPLCALKVQIHAGGRGKAGGVKLVRSAEEVRAFIEEKKGKPIVTAQTGPQGQKVTRFYLEAGCSIVQEFYLSLLVDRSTGWVTFIASSEGGMDIESVAHQMPEKIIKIAVDPATGYQKYHGRRLAFGLGLTGKRAEKLTLSLGNFYKALVHLDASLLEVNPLVLTQEEEFIALDAKMAFDDNALFRHPDVASLRDESEEDPLELEASRHGLSYIKLEGNIGCMVNGAGLAMATMDAIQLYGGMPANFLDVGGGASKDRVCEAFKLILSDAHVKGVLVNIFGGIMRCDLIAEGIMEAVREVRLEVPLVIRLEGTHADQGRALLRQSSLNILTAHDLGDAADKIVKAVKGGL